MQCFVTWSSFSDHLLVWCIEPQICMITAIPFSLKTDESQLALLKLIRYFEIILLGF